MAGNRYYDILGLPANATEKEIRKRYKELAKKYHPDKNPSPDAARLFIEINEAYQQLLSPTPKKSTSKVYISRLKFKLKGLITFRTQRLRTLCKNYTKLRTDNIMYVCSNERRRTREII